MMKRIDPSIIVKFNNENMTLEEAIKKIEPGEIIENVPIEYMDHLLITLKKRSPEYAKTYNYSTDRRYGNWRFILFGTRSNPP